MNNLSTFNFSSQDEKDIRDFCKLNDLEYDKFIRDCFDKGYQIEKYGLLTVDGKSVIEKEVIKEIPVEVIKEIEVEVIKEVIKEVPVETIKEVFVEKEVIKEVEIPKEVIVEKEVYVTDDVKVNELLKTIEELENKPAEIVEVIKEVEVVKEIENKEKNKKLQETIEKLRGEMRIKDQNILQLEKNLLELQEIKGPIKAQYMRTSNLNDNLYK